MVMTVIAYNFLPPAGNSPCVLALPNMLTGCDVSASSDLSNRQSNRAYPRFHRLLVRFRLYISRPRSLTIGPTFAPDELR
jgi:hypothetical protein